MGFSVLGFFVGLALWSICAKLAIGVYVSRASQDQLTALKNPADTQIRRILLLLGAASCTWIVGFGIAAALSATSEANIGWSWFFGGIAFSPAVIWATTASAITKIKRRRQQGMQI